MNTTYQWQLISRVCVSAVWLQLVGFPNGSLADAAPASGTISATQKGFVPLFNGHDLTGWDGDPRVWSVNDGVLTGRTNPADKSDSSFLVWTNGVVKDFELHFTFRVPQANSGVAYRGKNFGN